MHYCNSECIAALLTPLCCNPLFDPCGSASSSCVQTVPSGVAKRVWPDRQANSYTYSTVATSSVLVRSKSSRKGGPEC